MSIPEQAAKEMGMWEELLPIFNKQEILKILQYVGLRRKQAEVLPKKEEVFNAFRQCQFKDTKVVIIGQDPYPYKGVCDGLAFSSKKNYYPKSLQNIFEEILLLDSKETKEAIENNNYSLNRWAKQGVLLLNSCFTVEENKPGSHKEIWYPVLGEVFKLLKTKPNIVWILLGSKARAFRKYIEQDNTLVGKEDLFNQHPEFTHYILEWYHPAARNDQFKGAHEIFKYTNKYLNVCGLKAINW